MSRQSTLEQKRAEAAWKVVSDYKNAHQKDKDKQGKYRALSRSAPADIQANGLGQTLAFWRAKKEEHHTQLFDAVSNWVKSQINWKTDDHLLLWITNSAHTNDYRRATAETLAFLNWVKKFAEAELEESK